MEGSINSMKSAWANFVVGLGNDNADIADLSAQLIESVGTVAENVLPVIETVLTNIADTVKEQGPEMITKFVAYAIDKLPEVIALGLQMVLALVKGLAQNLPQLVQGTLNDRHHCRSSVRCPSGHHRGGQEHCKGSMGGHQGHGFLAQG